MKHRMYHSNNLRQALPEYAQRLGCSVEELESAYDWMLQNDVCFERQIKDDMLCSISYVNIEPRIEHPLARRFYAMLGKALKGFSGVTVQHLAQGRTLLEGYALFFIGTALLAVPVLLLCLALAAMQARKRAASGV